MGERLVATISAIGEFVGALAELFPKEKPLVAYDKRLQKTGVRNKVAMKKHFEEFESFFRKHGEHVSSGNIEGIPEDEKIVYASETYIAIGKILRDMEKDDTSVVFEHLRAIRALVSPEAPKEGSEQLLGSVISEAKQIGKNLLNSGKIDKSKLSGKPDAKAIAEIAPVMLKEFLESGAIERMVEKFDGKELDMGSVLGMIKGMAGEMQ
nr:putative RNA methyltransferase [Marseillevirus cajuinensis]